MTDEAEDIPNLEGSDLEEDESASMADDEYCKCASVKTTKKIKKHKNECPSCNLKMSDYDSDQESKIIIDLIRGMSTGQLGLTRTNKEQSQSSVKIKPPAFEGKGDPTHFFIKIKNFFEINKVQTEKEKSAILKSCLNEEALDLFIGGHVLERRLPAARTTA